MIEPPPALHVRPALSTWRSPISGLPCRTQHRWVVSSSIVQLLHLPSMFHGCPSGESLSGIMHTTWPPSQFVHGHECLPSFACRRRDHGSMNTSPGCKAASSVPSGRCQTVRSCGSPHGGSWMHGLSSMEASTNRQGINCSSYFNRFFEEPGEVGAVDGAGWRRRVTTRSLRLSAHVSSASSRLMNRRHAGAT